jgi:hypothetical protein
MTNIPQLFIDGVEIIEFSQFTLNFPGSNQLNNLNITINNSDMDNASLFGKDVELYLNCGANDNIPIFRGIIKQASPSDTEVQLKCLDVRCLLTGADALNVNITDNDNYDGFSVAQFLRSVISDKINTDKIRIGLDMLRDTDNIISMTGVRGLDTILNHALVKLDSGSDTTFNEEPLFYITDVEEGPEYSNIIIRKQKSLTNNPALNLSFTDGVKDFSYNRRPKPSTVTIVSHEYTTNVSLNETQGVFANTIKKDFPDPEEARKFAIIELKRAQQEVDEIDIMATKGHYIGLESIVNIDVDKDEIDGPHRLVSKNITFSQSNTGMSLSLRLNKRPIKVSEYLAKA